MTILLGVVAGILVYFFISWTLKHKNNNYKKLPPGPRGLPIIGNLHMIGSLPHRSFQKLSQKYGDILSVRLGQVLTIVVSSPSAAKLFLKTHDTVFAGRPKIQAAKYLSYGGKGIGTSDYGPYWRFLRKLTVQLVTTSKIETLAPLRKEKLVPLVKWLKKVPNDSRVVDVSAKVDELLEDIVSTMLFGDNNKIVAAGFKGLAREGIALSGQFNLSDFLPFLEKLDLQGLSKRMKKNNESFDKCLENIIEDYQKRTGEQQEDDNNSKLKSFVETLLSSLYESYTNPPEAFHTIQRNHIKALIADILAASTDTAVTAIEWTMSELLRNPLIMKRLQQELEDVVGMEHLMEEKDLPNLPYLDMVIKETFRLHPPASLLIPHESMEDIEINEYYIPKNSRILVNVWAIGRDANVWSENVEEFFPERFIGGNIDVRGHDFELIPFGSGRRICPGMQLGLTTVRFVVAQLVHCFNWKLPFGMRPCDLDMTENVGLTNPRANHLLALPTYRLLPIALPT